MYDIEENKYGDTWFITKTTLYSIKEKAIVKVEIVMIFYNKPKAVKYLKSKEKYNGR